jgi:hypothetical protein
MSFVASSSRMKMVTSWTAWHVIWHDFPC